MLTALGTDTVYDTVFVDYSLTGQTLDPNDPKYYFVHNRVGTLSYIKPNVDRYDAGNGNIHRNGAVTIQDIHPKLHTSNISGNVTTVSGNIQFNASMATCPIILCKHNCKQYYTMLQVM